MPRFPLDRFVASIALVAIVFLFRSPIEQLVGVGTSPILYLPAVTLAAWFGGLGPGLLATGLGAALWVYFDIPPAGSFFIPTAGDRFRIAVFAVEGVLLSALMERLHAARRASEKNTIEAERYRAAADRDEARLRAILDNSSSPIWVKDADGRYLLVNPSFEALARPGQVGTSGPAKGGSPLPTVAGSLEADDRVVMELGRSVETEETMQLDDGPHTFLSVKFPLLNSEGHVYAIGGISTDITDRKLAEDALRLERDFAEGLIEVAQVLVLVLDPDGRVDRVNSYLERVSGDRPEEVRGANWFDRFVPDRDKSKARDAFRRALQHEEGVQVVHAVVAGNGRERDLEWTHRLLEAGPGSSPRILAIGHDITELKQAQARAVQAERLAAIGQMVTGLAHESRNALQRSQACLEMLTFRLEGRGDELDLVAGIQDAQDDLQRLYEEVRCYAAPLHIDRRDCRLGELLREAWGQLEWTLRGRNARLVEWGDNDDRCLVDPPRMIQVFRNLLDNAIAACHDPVVVAVEQYEVDLGGRAAVRVALVDNGPGFSPEQRRNLFEPFHTTKIQGTGLGMAIARRIVEAHGGSIAAGSSGRLGAEIVITLPKGDA